MLRVPVERREAELKLAGYLVSRTGKLALEEQAAVAKRDWITATSKAEERLRLLEAHHRLVARRA